MQRQIVPARVISRTNFVTSKGVTHFHRFAPLNVTYSLYIRVRAFAVFSDETVDPRRDEGRGAEPSSAASVLAKFLLEPRAVEPEKVL